MNVEEFLSTIDAIRFDTDLDETYPELRAMANKIYPYLRKVYNAMFQAGMLTESHGQKKHNYPKNTLAAMRKGNRDAEKDILGDGFHSKSKLHKTAKKDKLDKMGKVNINNYSKFVDEAVKKTLREFVENTPDDFGKYYPGLEVNWGENIENLIEQLSNIFAEYNVPEENEYGFKRTSFEDLIAHLKYYYDVDVFNEKAFNAIYKLLNNYDLTSDEKVKNILFMLKKYC